MALPTRTGYAPAGVNDNRLVPCAASKWHAHHPSNEACRDCPLPTAESPAAEPYLFDGGWAEVSLSAAGGPCLYTPNRNRPPVSLPTYTLYVVQATVETLAPFGTYLHALYALFWAFDPKLGGSTTSGGNQILNDVGGPLMYDSDTDRVYVRDPSVIRLSLRFKECNR
jgi:hypothetical protein